MEITATSISARIGQYEQQKQSLIADLNAVDGAIQDCQYWLGQLEVTEDAGTNTGPNRDSGTDSGGDSSGSVGPDADTAKKVKGKGRRD